MPGRRHNHYAATSVAQDVAQAIRTGALEHDQLNAVGLGLVDDRCRCIPCPYELLLDLDSAGITRSTRGVQESSCCFVCIGQVRVEWKRCRNFDECDRRNSRVIIRC